MNDSKSTSSLRSSHAKGALILLYFLFFWSDLSTFRPGMDAMTYGTVAKNILKTGDWAVLHYADQAYADFYQHPPLAIWAMAVFMRIVSAIFGPEVAGADWVLKFLPSLVAGVGIYGVYRWASEWAKSRSTAGEKNDGDRSWITFFPFFATLVLITSTRYVKYSKGFMLDPFLATFSIWAIYLSRRYSLLSGFLVAGAFLSKGLFAFAPLAVILALDYRFERADFSKRLARFLSGFFAPILLWFALGDGIHYLGRYYAEHVSGRLGTSDLLGHLAPILNLFKVYWPWLPLFVLGTISMGRKITARTDDRNEFAALATAWAFIGGFTISGSFLEQYHVATYPFAALVVSYAIPVAWARFTTAIERTVLALGVLAGIVLFAFPTRFHSTEHHNPIRLVLEQATESCTDARIQRIAISKGVADIWYSLSIAGWMTEWDPRSVSPRSTPESENSQLLLAAATDMVGAGWIPTPIGGQGLLLYRAGSPSMSVADCSVPRFAVSGTR